MVQRVLLGDDGSGNMVFRVSRPGFDVLTADGSEVAFDSEFSNVVKVHMMLSYLGDSGVAAYVPFGKTFASPPPVIWMDKQNAFSGVPANDYESLAAEGVIVDYRSAYNQGLFRVSVTNSGIDVGRDAYSPMSLIILDVEQ